MKKIEKKPELFGHWQIRQARTGHFKGEKRDKISS